MISDSPTEGGSAMGFTVTRPAGTKDAEFEAYARLLHQQGKDLGKLPRIPDPANPHRRWVCVWNSEDDARRFATELNELPGESAWHVEPTGAAPSEGPFGPVLVQLARRGDGLSFALHPLSRAMIRDGFPHTPPGLTSAFIDAQTWKDFLTTRGDLKNLVASVLPPLTGLSTEQLNELGYAVVDAETDRTWVFVPPADILHDHV
jgi:hypothetical protein